MILTFLVLALLIWLVVKHANIVNVWFCKLLIQGIVAFGGIYFFITDVQHWYQHDYGLLHTLFYIIFYIIATIAATIWRMADMSAKEMKDDYKNAMWMSNRCPSCTKKLPNRMAKKCPHCTADL